MPWKTLATLSAVVLIVLATTSPYTHAANPFRRGGFSLDKGDLALLTAAGEKLYLVDDVEVGTIVKWSNPETGNRGIIKLVRKHEYKGLPCRLLYHRVKLKDQKDPNDFEVDRCKVASGEWKLLFQ